MPFCRRTMLVFRGRGRGLIEARPGAGCEVETCRPFSAAAAAASLKPVRHRGRTAARRPFSAAAAAASLKRVAAGGSAGRGGPFSAAAAAASLKHGHPRRRRDDESAGFPRHRAAASLKRRRAGRPRFRRRGFPRHRAAASLKPPRPLPRGGGRRRFPRHRAAASLKQLIEPDVYPQPGEVFRGIGPRPH